MLRAAALSAVAMVVAAAALVAAAPAAIAAPTSTAPATGGPAVISGHFTLNGLDGQQVTDANYRGKWLLVYFGYTYCPDVCPTVLMRIGQALKELGSVADRIQPLFITVDPERDTAPHLAQYMAAFDSRIVGLRGDSAQIRDAARQFHVYYRARSLGNGEYTVDHSSFVYVIAPDGNFRTLLADSLQADQLEETLRKLANEAP
jgi:cytochrome oxidase Cu insertion factor (SCO1/SenC/PrrC family)